MHALKTTCAGQIFALAKPHESVGKRTRNRIPKEERKALVESFIKKHQNLNNGSFPSLSLTHKEIGGSFYTIREIVREIIQENRVLGSGDFNFGGNGSNHLSSSIIMDPVPPLSLSPAGDESYDLSSEDGKTKSPEYENNINGSKAVTEGGGGSDILNGREVNGSQVFKEDDVELVHQSMDSTDISKTQFAASCSEKNRLQTVCVVDNKDNGFEEIPYMETDSTKPFNSDEMANTTKDIIGAIDMLEGAVVETFPLSSVTSTMDLLDAQLGELDKVCDGGEVTETKVEIESSIVNLVDLEEKETEVIVGQMPNHTSGHMEMKVREKLVNPASLDVECADTKETVVVNAVIGNNINETKAFSNGTLTSEQKIPTSGTELGSCKDDRAKVDTMRSYAGNEVASVEKKTTMEKGKLDASSDSSSSQKESNATLDRIKPESWKGDNMGRQETNPLLATLKSLLTAFVKFWSE